jgi:hypothetical protein
MRQDSERPGSRARSRSRRLAALLPVLAAALVCQAGDAPAGKAAQKKEAAELAWVSPDAAVVIRMRVADLMESEGFKVLAQLMPGGLDKLNQNLFKDMKPQDMEAITVVLPSLAALTGGRNPFRPAPGPKEAEGEMLIMVTVARPAVLAEMRKEIEASSKEKKFKDQTYYTDPDEKGMAVYFSGDRTIILGTAPAVLRGMGRKGPARARGLYAQAVAEALPRHQLVVGLKVSGKESGALFGQFGFNDRKMGRIFRPLQMMSALLFTLDFGKESRAAMQFIFPDKEKAEKALPAVQDLLVMLRIGMTAELIDRAETTLAESLDREEMEKAQFNLLCLEGLERVIRRARVEVKGESVQVALQTRADFTAVRAMANVLARKRLGDEKEKEGRKRKASEKNLKQIGLALHSHHDTYKRFPPPAICSKDGKPLLSWRVALLPYLDQDKLYKQFKLDEPWDSPHNKQLLEKMPKVYEPTGVKTKQPHTTFYQALVGPGAAWELQPSRIPPYNADGLKIPAFRDGTSNTLIVVETRKAVPWTKPEDVAYDPKGPLPKLGEVFEGGFHALFADGSVRFLPAQLRETTLRALITRAAGDIPGDDFKD